MCGDRIGRMGIFFNKTYLFPFLLAINAFLQCLHICVTLFLSVSMKERHICTMTSRGWILRHYP